MEKNKKIFDVIIVGGGHAGIEAANMACQFNHLHIGLVSLPDIPLVEAPCNPAIGGVGKGQVVREIDALGGVMGKLADLAGIQYRTLNGPKGYAVQSTRVQIDKKRYSIVAQEYLEKIPNLTIIRDFVEKITKKNEFFQIKLKTQITEEFKAKSIVITAGTFMGGCTHIGEKQALGGRYNRPASSSSKKLLDIDGQDFSFKRFKTGTPPRLLHSSIDWGRLEEQPSDQNTLNFHFLNDQHRSNKRHEQQISCFLTRTNEKTFQIIKDNIDRSPIFNGQIQAIGPRYCPSIEDKVHRYPDRLEHHIFLEPEGINSTRVYPNGVSTSLPVEVQEDFIKSIEGLENAQIIVPGYAVEYDVLDTSKMDATLEWKNTPGLFFAGQLNGTSGYEEAAGQGLVAGVNAALFSLGRDKWILPRVDSYIGVMIDDLITRPRDEPYRLFTARCENRLALREDNSFVRMRPYRLLFGLNSAIDQQHLFLEKEYKILERMGTRAKYQGIIVQEYLKMHSKKAVETLEMILEENNVAIHPQAIRAYAVDCVYSGAVEKSLFIQEKMLRLDSRPIKIENLLLSPNISFECKQRIKEYQPQNFRQLKNIPGIRAAALACVVGEMS